MNLINHLFAYAASVSYVLGQLTSNFDPFALAPDGLPPRTSNGANLNGMLDKLTRSNSEYLNNPTIRYSLGFKSQVKTASIADIKRFAKFSGASYCSHNTLSTWECSYCKQIGENLIVIPIIEDISTGVNAFVTTDIISKQIILTFRGTINIRNWLTNIDFSMVNFQLEGGSNIKVHSGFKTAMVNLSIQYTPIINELLAKYPDYKLILTGHSLGGAIANLALLDLQKSQKLPWDRVQLFTYGAPRIGNKAFALWVDSKPISISRVTNNRDIVPHVPFREMGYFHNQLEMFILGSKIRVCDNKVIEDPTCSLSMEPFLSIDDHNRYFDTAFNDGC